MSIRTSETERTPSIGRQVYLSGGKASARPTNLTRIASMSARKAAFTAAADSFAAASWPARAAWGRATTARLAQSKTPVARRRARDSVETKHSMGELLLKGDGPLPRQAGNGGMGKLGVPNTISVIALTLRLPYRKGMMRRRGAPCFGGIAS